MKESKKTSKKVDSGKKSDKQSCSQEQEKPLAKLIKLEVVGHNTTDNKNWWVVYDTNGKVTVKATTEEDKDWDKIKWDFAGQQAEGGETQERKPDNLGEFTVKASLAGGDDQEIKIKVVPELESVTVTENAEDKGGIWKAYVDDKDITIQAKTKPDTPEAWNFVTWDKGTDEKQKTKYKPDKVEDVDVKAKIEGQEKPLKLRICQMPELAIEKITFQGANYYTVEEDTLGNFDPPHWEKSRIARGKAPVEIFPAAYLRDQNIELSVTFKITKACTDDEEVLVRGEADFGASKLKWEKDKVKVKKTEGIGTEITIDPITSNIKLPDNVAFYNSKIEWKVNPDKDYNSPAGESKHLLYATLGKPQTTLYWTLLDISCDKAKGKNDADDVVKEAYKGFTNRDVKRRRDDKLLTYWGPKPSGTNEANSTQALLAHPDGSGECGSWAEFWVDMCKVHGITTCHKVDVRVNSSGLPSSTQKWGFLVKNWDFVGGTVSAHDSLTHRNSIDLVRKPGIPGQNNPDPTADFFNHFIVIYTGTNELYDPSYGGASTDQTKWEKGAIEGLFNDGLSPDSGFHTAKQSVHRNLLKFKDLVTGLTV